MTKNFYYGFIVAVLSCFSISCGDSNNSDPMTAVEICDYIQSVCPEAVPNKQACVDSINPNSEDTEACVKCLQQINSAPSCNDMKSGGVCSKDC